MHAVQCCRVKASVPRCPECGEAMVSHPGSHWEALREWKRETPWDICKTKDWASSERLANRDEYWRWLVEQKPEPEHPEVAFAGKSEA